MAYVSIPNDLSKIKTKLALNLTKRQLVCFGVAAVVGIPTYLFTHKSIGGTASMCLMVALMLPCFLFAMYERDGQPFEKVLWNIIRCTFLWPAQRPYKTENFYAALGGPKDTTAKEVQHLGNRDKKAQAARKEQGA